MHALMVAVLFPFSFLLLPHACPACQLPCMPPLSGQVFLSNSTNLNCLFLWGKGQARHVKGGKEEGAGMHENACWERKGSAMLCSMEVA